MNTLILVLSLVAGIVGTGLGGVIGVLLKNKGNKIMGRVLSFAGGVMVGVVTFEMLPEAIEYSKIENAIEQSGILIAVAALLVGMLVIFGLNKLLDVIENMRDTHRSIEELHHETKVIEANDALNADAVATVKTQEVDKKSLLKAGIIMLLAIALHNLPRVWQSAQRAQATLKRAYLSQSSSQCTIFPKAWQFPLRSQAAA